MGLRGYRGSQDVTRGDTGLLEVSIGLKGLEGLQGVRRCYRGLQLVS